MKILLVTNYLPDQQQSMIRYGDLLERELRARGHSVERISPPKVFCRSDSAVTGLPKWLAYLDKFVVFPPLLKLRARKADIVHICDHSNSMYVPKSSRTPYVITCHDLLAVRGALEHYEGVRVSRTGRVLQAWILNGLRRARNVVCVSRKTLDDWNLIIGSAGRIMGVIHNPLNWSYKPASAEAMLDVLTKIGIDPGEEYLLHVGGNQWYKRRLAVLQIFAETRRQPRFAEIKLVMAGKPWSADLHAFAKQNQLEDFVYEVTDCGNDDLEALYTGALALLFPSREEGFGWPILEAQSCGCAVITTNREPMREVAGEAAIFIDPNHPAAAAQIITAQIDRVPQLRAAGVENLRRFDLEKIMGRYSAFYEQVIARNPGAGAR